MPYPTPPGLRIAYDLEGAQLLFQAPLTLEILDAHPRSVQALNDEHSGGAVFPGPESVYVLKAFLILPTAYKIQGYLAEGASYEIFTTPNAHKEVVGVEFSSDSTNGVDGTFTTIQPLQFVRTQIDISHETGYSVYDGMTGFGHGIPLNDVYRRPDSGGSAGRGVKTVGGSSARNVRVVRLSMYVVDSNRKPEAALHLHLYGTPDTNATKEHLRFWKSSTDIEVSPGELDWGDVPLSSTADKSFRVKNNSDTKGASSILLRAVAAASSTTPAPHTMFLFSMDAGVTWLSELTIAALSPQAISSEILFRRVVPSNAELSNWAPRLTTEVGEWI
jgi:hypothetical protein